MSLLSKSVRAWAWGAGWDSSAGIIDDLNRGLKIDLITFADHGAEKRLPDTENGEEVCTYEFIKIFSDYIVSRGGPRPQICKYEPKTETRQRYHSVARQVVEELGLTDEFSESELNRLGGIYGNSVANATLPGLAFSMKSCSIKWKLQAQEPI